MIKGCGIGLRPQHVHDLAKNPAAVGFIEILGDNFFEVGTLTPDHISLFETLPVSVHCIGLNIGGQAPIDRVYVDQVKKLAGICASTAISDHLCWSKVGHQPHHDLMPIVLSEQELQRIASRVFEVQDQLQQIIALENVSRYLSFQDSTMGDCQFLGELSRITGCSILLDINNLLVNQFNHHEDAKTAIHYLRDYNVSQIHLAGHSHYQQVKVDHHGSPIDAETWDLYRYTLEMMGSIPTLIEWDKNIPPLTTLLTEKTKAEQIQKCFPDASPMTRVPPEHFPCTPVVPPPYDNVAQELFERKTDPLSRWVASGETPVELGREIYRRNLVMTVVQQGEDRLPLSNQLLGKNNLRFFIKEFMDQKGLEVLNVDKFYQELSSFTQERSELEALPWLRDLMSLELAYYQVFHGGPQEAVTIDLNYAVRDLFLTMTKDPSEDVEEPKRQRQVVRIQWQEDQIHLLTKNEKSPPAAGPYPVFHPWNDSSNRTCTGNQASD